MIKAVPLDTISSSLQSLLSGIPAVVTTLPPDVARRGIDSEQVNLFLYAVSESPHSGNPGVNQQANWRLDYMVTAYGAGENGISAQKVMGQVIALLDDQPMLEIARDQGESAGIGSVQITRDSLSAEEMSRLWLSFRTAYRLSLGYRVRFELEAPAG